MGSRPCEERQGSRGTAEPLARAAGSGPHRGSAEPERETRGGAGAIAGAPRPALGASSGRPGAMSGFSPELIDYLEGKISFEEFERRREERKSREKVGRAGRGRRGLLCVAGRPARGPGSGGGGAAPRAAQTLPRARPAGAGGPSSGLCRCWLPSRYVGRQVRERGEVPGEALPALRSLPPQH